MYANMTIIAAFVFVYSLAGKGLAKTAISGAVVFTAFGLILGPAGLGYLELSAGAEQIRLLAELTLALLLFTDAANSNLGVIKKNPHSRAIIVDRATADDPARLWLRHSPVR